VALFLVLALVFARTAYGVADAPTAAAEGSLSLDGRTIPFHYAYVTEHGTLWVTLSGSPLDRGQLKKIDFGHLPSEDAVFLEIHINGQKEATSISVRAKSLDDGLLSNDDVGVFSARVASPERVEGSLALPLPREIRGHRLFYSVRFRALPPAPGPIRNLDDALDRAPSIRRLLRRVHLRSDGVLGIGLLGSLLLLFALVLAWALVIAPRRARSLFRELEGRGYAEMDAAAPELQSAINSLAPIMLEGTVGFEEGPRRTLNALVRSAGFRPRYVVNVVQTYETALDPSPTWQTLVLEARSLRLETEFSVRLRELDHVGRCRRRFNRRSSTSHGLSGRRATPIRGSTRTAGASPRPAPGWIAKRSGSCSTPRNAFPERFDSRRSELRAWPP
jgi:hypothetical protein